MKVYLLMHRLVDEDALDGLSTRLFPSMDQAKHAVAQEVKELEAEVGDLCEPDWEAASDGFTPGWNFIFAEKVEYEIRELDLATAAPPSAA
jgi:hypothetical protein